MCCQWYIIGIWREPWSLALENGKHGAKCLLKLNFVTEILKLHENYWLYGNCILLVAWILENSLCVCTLFSSTLNTNQICKGMGTLIIVLSLSPSLPPSVREWTQSMHVRCQSKTTASVSSPTTIHTTHSWLARVTSATAGSLYVYGTLHYQLSPTCQQPTTPSITRCEHPQHQM